MIVRYMLAKCLEVDPEESYAVDVINPKSIDLEKWGKDTYRGYYLVPFIGDPVIVKGTCFAIVEQHGIHKAHVIALYADWKEARRQMYQIFNTDDPELNSLTIHSQGIKIVSGYVNEVS